MSSVSFCQLLNYAIHVLQTPAVRSLTSWNVPICASSSVIFSPSIMAPLPYLSDESDCIRCLVGAAGQQRAGIVSALVIHANARRMGCRGHTLVSAVHTLLDYCNARDVSLRFRTKVFLSHSHARSSSQLNCCCYKTHLFVLYAKHLTVHLSLSSYYTFHLRSCCPPALHFSQPHDRCRLICVKGVPDQYCIRAGEPRQRTPYDRRGSTLVSALHTLRDYCNARDVSHVTLCFTVKPRYSCLAPMLGAPHSSTAVVIKQSYLFSMQST